MLRSAIRLLALAARRALESARFADAETAGINIHKPYKPRRIKNDMVHRMARQIYKMKKRDPAFKRKRALYRKKYLQKNGRNLKRRSEYVREVRKDRGLND